MIQDMNELLSIAYAPGEGKVPISLLKDIYAEYLSFSTLYGGRAPTLPPKTTYAAQCKYELRHYDSRFRRAVHNILYKVKRLTMVKLSSSIGIALRQGTRAGKITAKDLLNNAELETFIRQDACKCLDNVKLFSVY